MQASAAVMREERSLHSSKRCGKVFLKSNGGKQLEPMAHKMLAPSCQASIIRLRLNSTPQHVVVYMSRIWRKILGD